jgi:2-pyrone-4,6-dicarboxylate lactonase
MGHSADTRADPPYWMATPSNPKLKLPPGACDAHVHVFGPRARFPFADVRRYTPSDAPKELLFKLHERLGVQHCVIVQPACHATDNSVTIDAIAATGGSYKGVALVSVTISDAELKRLDGAGLCGARFHYMTHLAKGPHIDDVIRFGKRLADIGWHLQIHTEADLLAALAPALRRSPVPVVSTTWDASMLRSDWTNRHSGRCSRCSRTKIYG